jgi:hypothetical protein
LSEANFLGAAALHSYPMAHANAEKQRRRREKRKVLAKSAPEHEAGLVKLTSLVKVGLGNDADDSR